MKPKAPPSPFQETEEQTLRVTTLLAVPSREAAPRRPPVRAGGVTPATRPCLLASSFSRRLQGDFRRHARPPRTETAALLAGPCPATRPYQRPDVQLTPMISRFSRLSTGKIAHFPGAHLFLCRASSASSPANLKSASDNTCSWAFPACFATLS